MLKTKKEVNLAENFQKAKFWLVSFVLAFSLCFQTLKACRKEALYWFLIVNSISFRLCSTKRLKRKGREWNGMVEESKGWQNSFVSSTLQFECDKKCSCPSSHHFFTPYRPSLCSYKNYHLGYDPYKVWYASKIWKWHEKVDILYRFFL